ncbi:dTDP-4-dehydrorhamnose reductase [Desulfobotulus alkaliphilus]|uniref:dTDP-4-dehydrorhamnose reductase n=1 Tax=Desulfobotulus alkaliphilus TaxID=622671 RepID=A0A562RIJ4_9BACT|nr:dTDP-4-dehydrorhamnose reductase [Desulfobotulus alkaliphilus]TWI68919.1 dTDP-4-dehydrorhamnose reductase [Desulfobotulus alkaliphilus]
MRRVLVTGADGQLGHALASMLYSLPKEFFPVLTDHASMDITDVKKVNDICEQTDPDIIVNCAAYTAVDMAEVEAHQAFAVNEKGAANVAMAAFRMKIPMLHFSTDYVFDGSNNIPYTEEDSAAPLSVYGHSKLAGEFAVMATCPWAVIIRTGWLYSPFRSNFFTTISRIARERGKLEIICDQVGTPTYAKDLASAAVHVFRSMDGLTCDEMYKYKGVYHYSNEGVCSWYDFACAIVDLAGITCVVDPIETKDYPQTAQRPHFSVMNKSKFKNCFHTKISHWQRSLAACMESSGISSQ